VPGQRRGWHQIGESPHATIIGPTHELVHARFGKPARRPHRDPIVFVWHPSCWLTGHVICRDLLHSL